MSDFFEIHIIDAVILLAKFFVQNTNSKSTVFAEIGVPSASVKVNINFISASFIMFKAILFYCYSFITLFAVTNKFCRSISFHFGIN